jgi:hypothetical protein
MSVSCYLDKKTTKKLRVCLWVWIHKNTDNNNNNNNNNRIITFMCSVLQPWARKVSVTRNTVYMLRKIVLISLSVYVLYVEETVRSISMKFCIGGIYWNLLDDGNFDSHIKVREMPKSYCVFGRTCFQIATEIGKPDWGYSWFFRVLLAVCFKSDYGRFLLREFQRVIQINSTVYNN